MEIYNPCGNQFENHNTTTHAQRVHCIAFGGRVLRARVRFQLVLVGSSITLFESIKLRTKQERAVTVAAHVLRSTTRQFQFNEQYKLCAPVLGNSVHFILFFLSRFFSNFLFIHCRECHISVGLHVSENHFGCYASASVVCLSVTIQYHFLWEKRARLKLNIK